MHTLKNIFPNPSLLPQITITHTYHEVPKYKYSASRSDLSYYAFEIDEVCSNRLGGVVALYLLMCRSLERLAVGSPEKRSWVQVFSSYPLLNPRRPPTVRGHNY